MLPTWLLSIHHDGSPNYLSNPVPAPGERVRVRLRAGLEAPLRRVFLRTEPDGEQAFTLMVEGAVAPPARWFEADLLVCEPVAHYRFVLEAEDGVYWFSAAGPSDHDPLDQTDFRLVPGFSPPPWARGSVFYQVFVDRFASGDAASAPRAEEYTYGGARPRTFAWEEPPGDHAFPLVFYGGDLPGLASRLDHLEKRLGVNGLYLTPVFTSPSNHRYDVSDYGQVDPHLGGDRALVALRKELDRRGMRYLLDVVPNHAGYAHPWFTAARADAAAPEAAFFSFSRHPDAYFTWLGVWSLPKLDYRSEELRQRMISGPGSVIRRWLEPPFSADGWRVDVANMLGRQGEVQLGPEVARLLRHAVKEANPAAWLIGENWFDASQQLQGDQYDGMMNYGGFTFPLWHWLRGYEQEVHGAARTSITGPAWSTAALAGAWRSRRAAIPWMAALHQYNLLGSHDVSRIRTRVGGSDALHRLAVALLLTYPGVPGLYYGDEIGMEDAPGLAQRGCMVWDESRWNRELLDYHRDLVRLRRSSAALREGGFQVLAVEEDTLVFQREHPEGRVLTVGHRGERPRPAGELPVAHGGLPDGTLFIERLSGAEAVVKGGRLPLPEQPQGASIWVSER